MRARSYPRRGRSRRRCRSCGHPGRQPRVRAIRAPGLSESTLRLDPSRANSFGGYPRGCGVKLDYEVPRVSTILVILLVLLLLLAAGAVVVAQQRRQRNTRQARVEADARRAEAQQRLEASERERALAERQLERADKVDPDRV